MTMKLVQQLVHLLDAAVKLNVLLGFIDARPSMELNSKIMDYQVSQHSRYHIAS